MMLPNTSISSTQPDGTPTASDTAKPETVATETAPAMAPGESPHVDYNLHPLKVASLEHYIEQPEGAERFRVS